MITPGGNTSSYPPHKHDTDNLPRESLLEEVYYHRLNPPQGFAFQRVYTDDRSLDETMTVEDGDVTLVPRGYHPCAALHGYDLYYLNVMAGPKRTWKFHNEPAHEWLLKSVTRLSQGEGGAKRRMRGCARRMAKPLTRRFGDTVSYGRRSCANVFSSNPRTFASASKATSHCGSPPPRKCVSITVRPTVSAPVRLHRHVKPPRRDDRRIDQERDAERVVHRRRVRDRPSAATRRARRCGGR